MSNAPKGQADFLALGDWNAICSVCGRKYKASTMVKLPKGVGGPWGGDTYVCQRDWRPRQTQDFVRGIPDKITPPWTQPPVEGAPGGLYVYNIDDPEGGPLTVTVTIIDDPNEVVTASKVMICFMGGSRTSGLTLVNEAGGTTTREVVIVVNPDAIVDEILDDEDDPVDPTITILPGGSASLYELAFTVQPTDSLINQAITPPVEVTLRTFSGATVTDAVGTVSVALLDARGASLGGTLTAALVAGVATFSDLEVDLTNSDYSLLASTDVELTHTATSETFAIGNYLLEAAIHEDEGTESIGYIQGTAGDLTPTTLNGFTIIALSTSQPIGIENYTTLLSVSGLADQDLFFSLSAAGKTFFSADATFLQQGGNTSWLWQSVGSDDAQMFSEETTYTVTID